MTENNLPLLKREGESDFDYHKRLIYGKLVDKTLSDYDYAELSKYIYGKELAPDETRKRMYGSQQTLELIDSNIINNITEDSLLSELENKRLELQKEKQRFQDQRREFNKIISAEGRAEHICSTLAEAANNLNTTIGKLDFEKKVNTSDLSDNDAVLVLSDWHYGMITNNIFNSYNKDVCKFRVSQIVDETIQRIKLHKSRNLIIVILGDLFHGGVHTGTRVASEELVCDQMMQVSEILAQTIAELSKYVNKTVICMTYGNHARTIQNKDDSIHRDNMERVVRWWLETRFNNTEDISVLEESEYDIAPFNVRGHWFCAIHGDLDNVKTSPRLLATLLHKQIGIDLEYILLGDKHHRESFDELGITAMLCGSLCGADDYANDKRLYSTPSQLLLIVNDDGVDAEYRLRC